jgi:hypothetical protein
MAVNQTLGQYQILEELGRGGMAVVYKAYQPALDRYVAIKVLPQQFTFDQEFVERFLREARAAAKLNHTHIVTIHDVGQADGTYFIVMEYLEGPSLADLIRRHGALPPQQVAQIVAQMASALDYAHGQGFVHRDVKPSNILLDAGGAAKLADFGIVRAAEGTRLTQTGTLLGTPEYMSPEQAKGLGLDRRSDVYSLAVVAYEMLAGRELFSGDTLAVMHAHAYDSPDLRPLSAGVQEVLGRALAKDPRQRYESAGAFAQDLQKAVSGMPVGQWVVEPPTRVVARPGVARPGARAVPTWVWGVGGLAAVALIAGILIALSPDEYPPISTPVLTNTVTLTQPPDATDTPEAREAPSADTASPTPTNEVGGIVSPMPPPSPSPTREVGLRWVDIGRSVQGRTLSMAVIGDDRGSAVVVVGSIQGDQSSTRDLTNSLITYFDQREQQVPDGVVFYFLPSLNPDGNATNSRYNANAVDLNRNWETADWRSKAAVPGQPQGKSGAGGSHPFSEPETCALRDFLFGLAPRRREILVVELHSSVHRTEGEVYPGGDNAVDIAYRYASAADYDVESQWAEYTTSGEMVTWCAEQGIVAIDVVIPGSQGPSSRIPGTSHTLLDITVQALLEIALFP